MGRTEGLREVYMDETEAMAWMASARAARLTPLLLVAGLWGASPATANPITDENAKTGDPGWQTGVSTLVAPASNIEGYTSQVSASPGGDVQFHVRTSSRYRIVIYRLGWYRGVGGRRVACLPSCTSDRPPASQPAPPSPDRTTGIVRAGWSVTDTFHVPTGATSGYYLAEFVLTSGTYAGHARWYPFIVRPATGTPPSMLVVVPVNTWQAYNNWGGKSLYSYNSTNSIAANHVSFDRPLTSPNAPVFGWEIQGLRYLERNGYDVGYVTDVNVDQDASVLLQRPAGLTPQQSAVMILGHSECWSKSIRDALGSVVNAGRNVVAMGADLGQWQVRYEDGDRTLVEYRSATADPSSDPATKTTEFRLLTRPVHRVSCSAFALLGGVYYPVSILPAPLEWLGKVLPFTWGLDVLRQGLLTGHTDGRHLVLLLASGVIALPASLMIFRLGLRYARRAGTLAQY